jgi:hypothetical protein
MNIATHEVDGDMPAQHVRLKFRGEEHPSLFITIEKAAIDAKNFSLAADILRRNADEASVKLAAWFDVLASRYRGGE